MQDAEKTPGRQGDSQPRTCAPGLEVSLRELTQRRLLQLCLSQQLFEARVLLAQLTQLLGLTTTHRPITLAPPAQRRLADTQHAASLSCAHALTSQRLGLLQLHDNLLRRALRELPHAHPFCPATNSRDYSEQPSHNKRSEKPRPLQQSAPCLDAPNGTGSGWLFKNVACNSIEGPSRFEVRTLKFCGFQVLVDTCYRELHARFWALGVL